MNSLVPKAIGVPGGHSNYMLMDLGQGAIVLISVVLLHIMARDLIFRYCQATSITRSAFAAIETSNTRLNPRPRICGACLKSLAGGLYSGIDLASFS